MRVSFPTSVTLSFLPAESNFIGAVCARSGSTITFRVKASDADDHMCQGVVTGQVANYILQNTNLSVQINGTGIAATVPLVSDQAGNVTVRNWHGSWSVPTNTIGQMLSFQFRGSIADKPCSTHDNSNDPDVSLDGYCGQFAVYKVDMEPNLTNLCWKVADPVQLILTNSWFGAGGIEWSGTNGLKVVSADNTKLVFTPTNSTPASYTVRATARDMPTCRDESTVNIIKIDSVDVHAFDSDTHKIPAVSGAAHDDHFVCVQDTGDVVFNATVSPNDPAVFDQLVWEADGATITYPAVGTDKRTAKLSSSSSTRVPVRIKVGSSTCWGGVAWIVWANGTSNNRPLSFIVGTSGSNIAADWDFAWDITPAQIITDADRPELSGANTVSPPNGSKRHVISNNPLSGGADKKWDASRQGQFKVINPHLYTKSQLPSVPGTYYDNQPVALDLPDVYPSDPAEGNDDSHPGDEDNDPYTAPAQGSLAAVDTPSAPMKTATGALNDMYEERYHFREFARIELGGVWYRMSDNLLWRVHYKYKKANTQITTGANGVCNTTASGDDVQVIALNSGKARATSITAGTNGTIDTTPAGDDQLVAGTITTGADGICNTTAIGDDVQVIPVGAGEPNAICITPGLNTKLDTTPGGDDVGATVRWVDNGSDQAADNNGF